MKKTKYGIVRLICAGALAATVAITASAAEVHWSYEGEAGPEHWGDLSPDYHLCKDGKQQSPVDIAKTTEKNLGKISFNYSDTTINAVNNGHTLQFNINAGTSYIVVAGKRYDLLQFHFHTPSEHKINGVAKDMVVHLVHKAADGTLAVIGVMMDNASTGNALMDKLITFFPEHEQSIVDANQKFNPKGLLPYNTAEYFNYPGSLTTPPCSEGVNWIKMKNTIKVSTATLEKFKSVFHANARPVQPLNTRKIRKNDD